MTCAFEPRRGAWGPAETDTIASGASLSADANHRLADAHRRLAETKQALEASRVSATRAREFAAEIGHELARQVRRNEDRAAVRAATLMRSLKVVGASPKLRSSPKLADDHIKRLDAENRAAAARQACEELAAEERVAAEAVDDAHAELEAAARGVLAMEAQQRAVRIAALEREALQHRVELEGAARCGAFGIRQNGLSDLAKRILRGNESLPIGTRNTAEWRASNESAEAWRRRLAILLKHPDPAPADSRVA
jgi:hypothetical protein